MEQIKQPQRIIVSGKVVGGDRRQISNVKIHVNAFKELFLQSSDPINDRMQFLKEVSSLFYERQQSAKEIGKATLSQVLLRKIVKESLEVTESAKVVGGDEISQVCLEIVDDNGPMEPRNIEAKLQEIVNLLANLNNSLDNQYKNLVPGKSKKILTPKQQEELIRLFEKNNYETSPNKYIQRMFHEKLDIEYCYVNLSIVEQGQQSQKEKKDLGELQSNFKRLSSYEDIFSHSESEMITIKDLFSNMERNCISIAGRPGSGKTVLCKKIVAEFLKCKHNNEDLWPGKKSIIWIPLRNLKSYLENPTSPLTLIDVFYYAFFYNIADGKELAEQLLNVTQMNSDDTVYLLDGWDEVAEEQHSKIFGPVIKTLLNQKNIIITSRNYALPTLKDIKFNLKLENMGFSKQNIIHYIEIVLCEKPNVLKEVKDFVEGNPVVFGLANIPVNLDLICESWEVLKLYFSDKEQFITISQLYEALVSSFWINYLSRSTVREELERQGPQMQRLIKFEPGKIAPKDAMNITVNENLYLELLAFWSFVRNKILINQFFLSKAAAEINKKTPAKLDSLLMDSAKQSFLLTTSDQNINQRLNEYNFAHLTLQEYLAAKYIARIIKTNTKLIILEKDGERTSKTIEKFIAEHKYNPRFEIIWPFVAGILKEDKAALEKFFLNLKDIPHDAVGFYEQLILIRCLEECQLTLDKALSSEILNTLIPWLRDALFDFTPSEEFIKILSYSPHVVQLPVIQNLFRAASNHSTETVIFHTIENLSKLHVIPSEATQAIYQLALLEEEVKYSALRAASKLLNPPEELIPNFLDKLISDKNSMVKNEIINFIAKLPDLSMQAISFIIHFMQYERIQGITPVSCISLLGQLRERFPPVSEILMELFIKTRNEYLYSDIVRALCKTEKPTLRLVNFLKSLLNSKNTIELRSDILNGLAKLSENSREAFIILKDCLSLESPDYKIAIKALGELTKPNLFALSSIKEILTQSTDDNLLKVAMSSADKLLKFFPSQISLLLNTILSDNKKSFEVRIAAIHALRSNIILNLSIFGMFKEILFNQQLSRDFKISILGIIKEAKEILPQAVDILIEMYNKAEDEDMKYNFVFPLTRLSSKSREVSALISKEIKQKNIKFSYIHRAALRGQLIISNETILFLLSEAQFALDVYERRSALLILSTLKHPSPEAIAAILQICRVGQDAQTRYDARYALQFLLPKISFHKMVNFIKNNEANFLDKRF